MSFFGNLFGTKGNKVVALIDIGSASIGGAYVELSKKDSPTIHYTTRVAIDMNTGEDTAEAMRRSLSAVAEVMQREGAPALVRTIGQARTDSVLVSVAAPWQQTDVTIKTIEPGHPFTFTHAMMREALHDVVKVSPGRKATDNSIIATMLNGYETHVPFGKHVNRADLVVLSSSIEATVAESINRTVRKSFHTHHIEIRAFLPMSYTVLRDVYPHEKNFFILDVSGEATDIALVKHGLLVGAHTFDQGTRSLIRAAQKAGVSTIHSPEAVAPLASSDSTFISSARNQEFGTQVGAARSAWLSGLAHTLQLFSDTHALARNIFVLADEDVREFLHHALDEAELRKLWLSDEPLRILPVQPGHFAHFVRTRGEAEGDIFTAIMALYAQRNHPQ